MAPATAGASWDRPGGGQGLGFGVGLDAGTWGSGASGSSAGVANVPGCSALMDVPREASTASATMAPARRSGFPAQDVFLTLGLVLISPSSRLRAFAPAALVMAEVDAVYPAGRGRCRRPLWFDPAGFAVGCFDAADPVSGYPAIRRDQPDYRENGSYYLQVGTDQAGQSFPPPHHSAETGVLSRRTPGPLPGTKVSDHAGTWAARPG